MFARRRQIVSEECSSLILCVRTEAAIMWNTQMFDDNHCISSQTFNGITQQKTQKEPSVTVSIGYTTLRDPVLPVLAISTGSKFEMHRPFRVKSKTER